MGPVVNGLPEVANDAVRSGRSTCAVNPIMQTRVAGIEMKWPAALINVYEQSGVKISGSGVVDGDGKQWWDRYWEMRRED